MKLCAQKLKILFTCFLFLALGLLSGIHHASADIAVSDISDSGGYITIPSYDGHAILLCGQTGRDPYAGLVRLSTDTYLNRFTRIFNNYNNYYYSDYQYILDPTPGTLAFNAWQEYWGGGEHKCNWITGVSDTPIVATSSSADLTYTGSDEDNLIIRIGGKYQYDGEDTDTVDSQLHTRYCSNDFCYWGHYGFLDSSNQYTFTADNSSYRGFIEIQKAGPTYSCGDDICTTEFEDCFTCSADCGYCEGGYDPEPIITFDTILNTGALIDGSKTIVRFSYDQSKIPNNSYFFDDYLTIVRCNDANCTDASSSPVYFTDWTDATSSYSYILSKLTTPEPGTGLNSTPGRSLFTLDPPIDRLGTSTTVWEYYKITPHYLDLAGLVMNTRRSEVVGIIWQSEYGASLEIPGSYAPSCDLPTFDFDHICDDIDLSGVFGWGDIYCGVKSAIYTAGYYSFIPSCSSLNSIGGNFNSFKRSFPFNTFFDLTDSLNSAIVSAQNSTSTPHNFSLPFIRKTATSSKYYMLPVLASSSFVNLIGQNNYNLYLNTLGFIWWLLIAVIVYFTVRKV